jgi:hypothetical protein
MVQLAGGGFCLDLAEVLKTLGNSPQPSPILYQPLVRTTEASRKAHGLPLLRQEFSIEEKTREEL